MLRAIVSCRTFYLNVEVASIQKFHGLRHRFECGPQKLFAFEAFKRPVAARKGRIYLAVIDGGGESTVPQSQIGDIFGVLINFILLGTRATTKKLISIDDERRGLFG